MKLQKWDLKEIARLESVLAKRRSLLDDVDAEVERLRGRRREAVVSAESNLNAAKHRAATRAQEVNGESS